MNKNIKLSELLDFVLFTVRFQNVKRKIFAPGQDRKENDLEHSGQLALVAWYINDSLKLKLNSEKILKYSLAHDLVEAYAGDVSFFDKKERKNKKQNEEKARLELKKNFSEFSNLHRIIIDYEELSDDEAKFVYSIDKLLPAINIYLDDGRSWRLERVDLKKLKKYKSNKIMINDVVNDYYLQLVKLLEENEEKLFG